MKTGKVMKGLTVVSLLAVVVVFAVLVRESRMLSYLSEDPKVCINCHPMRAYYESWSHSAHGNRTTCVDCHLPQDSAAGKLLAKAEDGLRHAMAMTFRTYGNALRLNEKGAGIVQKNCIACHGEVVSQIVANSALYTHSGATGLQTGRPCWECHRETPHGTESTIMAAQDTLVFGNGK